jgi:hypothetical protein
MDVVQRLSGRELVAVMEEVAETELQRIETERIGCDIHHPLGGPDDLGDGITAEGTSRWKVGINTVRVDRHVRNPIGSDTAEPALASHIRSAVGVGTRVPVRLDLFRQDAAIASETEANGDHRRMPGKGDELLVTVEHQLDRTASEGSQKSDLWLDARKDFTAEGSAHRWDDDPDPLRGMPKS